MDHSRGQPEDLEMGALGQRQGSNEMSRSRSAGSTSSGPAGRPTASPITRLSNGNPAAAPGGSIPTRIVTGSSDGRMKQMTSQQKVHELASQVKVLGADAVAKMADMAGGEQGRQQVQVERDFMLPKGVIHPLSPGYRFWWWATICAACASGWLEPYQIGFLDPSLRSNSGLAVVQYLLTAIFVADIVLSFFVSYYTRGILEISHRAIITNYLQWRLWWDLLTTLPWDQIVLAGVGLTGTNNSTARYIGLLSLLRLGRLYRLGRLFRHLVYNLATPLLLTTLVRNATLLFYLVHWFGCIFYFMARQGGFSSSTWVGQAPEVFVNKSPFEAYLVSVMWALSVFYTLGEGDLSPVSTPEVVWVLVFVAINIFCWAYVMGSMTLLVFKQDEKVCTYRNTMRNLEVYSRAHHLPKDIKALVQSHLRLQLSCQEASDGGALLSHLPFTIKQKVLRHMYMQQLTNCWLLSGVKPKFMDALLAVARVETLMPRVEILGQGDYVNELLLLVDGFVEVFASVQTVEDKDREDLMQRHTRSPEEIRAEMAAAKNAAGSNYQLLGPGDCFGEFAFFTEVAQFELVRSLTVCRILAVSRPDYNAIASSFPNSARTLLSNLQQRAEGLVQREFRGGAASRLLRGSLMATLPGLTYHWTSAEQVSNADAEERADRSGSGPGTGRLSSRQQQVMGNLQRVKALVKQHVASTNETRTGQFLSAAAHGEQDRIRLMLQQGFEADTADYDHRTALMLAAANGRKDVVDMLLAAGSKPNIKDNLGSCPLMEAVKGGHDDIIEVLMRKGATLNLTQQQQVNQLYGAITTGDAVLLRRLLRCKVDASVADQDAKTPLHVAAAAGNLVAVQVLVEQGRAQLGLRSRYGRTPLDEARAAQVQPVVDYLEQQVGPEEAAASRARFEDARADAAMRAAASGNVAELQALLARGCSADAADYDRRTVLMLGAAKGHAAVVQLLLAAGANPNLQDNLGGCALVEAVKAGHDDIVKQLVAAGAGLCLSSGELGARLCGLVYQNNSQLLLRYIAAGADINAGDYDKRTALHIAAAEGNLDLVKLLVEQGGADSSVVDRWGSTPLKEAQRVGAAPVAQYLQQLGAQQRRNTS